MWGGAREIRKGNQPRGPRQGSPTPRPWTARRPARNWAARQEVSQASAAAPPRRHHRLSSASAHQGLGSHRSTGPWCRKGCGPLGEREGLFGATYSKCHTRIEGIRMFTNRMKHGIPCAPKPCEIINTDGRVWGKHYEGHRSASSFG